MTLFLGQWGIIAFVLWSIGLTGLAPCTQLASKLCLLSSSETRPPQHCLQSCSPNCSGAVDVPAISASASAPTQPKTD